MNIHVKPERIEREKPANASSITVTPAETLLYRLTALGVDYIFINAGTDYPPMIEGMSKDKLEAIKIPGIVTCAHENAAMGMAQGYYFATGKSQAVMTHTNVGLANAICGLINACSDNVPTLLFSGRTPITEQGRLGSRDTPIGYGQEMRDQAALVRESVKWDFELREPEQIANLIDRAYAIANSLPKGPVYLSLPREPLCEPYECASPAAAPTILPTSYAPHPDSVAMAAELIAKAKKPIICSQRGAGSAEGFRLLSKLANSWGIPVVEYWAIRVAVSDNDPMAAGPDPAPWIRDADVIIAIDSLTPWMPLIVRPSAQCPVIQIGPDPLFEKTPVRSFRADVSLCGEVAVCLKALIQALEGKTAVAAQADVTARRNEVARKNAEAKTKRLALAQAGSGEPISKPWLSHCMGQIAEKYDGKIVSELVTLKEFTGLTRPDTYYQEALSGGLGEAFPIALGMQLADRNRLIIAAMGDGSYLFSNPIVCFEIAETMKLPILAIIGNNKKWNAVRASTLGLYPHGYASKMNIVPATELSDKPGPDFTKIAAAMNAYSSCVTDGQNLIKELEKAVEFIRREKRAALVEVMIG
jgi:acetolactate synthase I/II/III large subunit